MELNPTNPVTLRAHGEWHKIAALIMVKFGLDEVKITPDDIAKLVAGNVNIVLDARGERETGCLTLRIVDDKTAAKLVEDEKVEGN